MMRTRVDDRLRHAAAHLRLVVESVPVPDPPSKGRMRLAPVVAGAVGTVATVALLVVATVGDFADRDVVATITPAVNSPAATQLPADGPIFGEATGVVLLVDDGIDGLTAIDPDRRLATRSVVEGQRSGDEEHSMILVGDHLVVGWGEPHAVDLTTGEALSLGEATVFVPAAENDRVWMIDTSMSIGAEPAQVWQVDVTTGESINEPIPLGVDGHPQIGVPGGLAVHTGTALELWDMNTGETTILEAQTRAFALDVRGDDLLWCSADCSTLAATDTSDLDHRQFQSPDGYHHFVRSSISPDGGTVAALLGKEADGNGRAIWILERDTGNTTVVADPHTHVDYLAWSPDSSQLFATSYGYGEDQTVLWRYDLGDQRFGAVVLPFGGTLTPVVVDRSLATPYIGDRLREPEDCQAPTTQPSGRTGICTFGY